MLSVTNSGGEGERILLKFSRMSSAVMSDDTETELAICIRSTIATREMCGVRKKND